MTVRFRNVDVPENVADWPYEAIVTALERGTVSDWAVLTREVASDPWGETARQVEDYLSYAEDAAVAGLLHRRIAAARDEVDSADREEVARTVRNLVARSGLSRKAFARRIGTSRSRLSTYCSGTVTPSASLMLRMERVAVSLEPAPGNRRL